METDAKWLESVLSGQPNEEDADRVHRMIRERGALSDALGRAQGFIQRARSILDSVDAADSCGAARASLELATDYVLKRQR